MQDGLTLSYLLLGGFLGLPAIVLALRASRWRRLSWRAAFAMVILVGWALVLAAAIAGESPDNGAPKVFALYFGWAYALLWFAPWLLLYGLLQLGRRLYSYRHGRPPGAPIGDRTSP